MIKKCWENIMSKKIIFLGHQGGVATLCWYQVNLNWFLQNQKSKIVNFGLYFIAKWLYNLVKY